MSMNQLIVHVNFVDIEAYEQTCECGNERMRNLLGRALLSQSGISTSILLCRIKIYLVDRGLLRSY